ncbi:hypothetical protein, partial [Celeribacter halophilus]|uniref:hypothetical protein n=1 Tax=Celeribacter halophilus TaxID=576117 RepID=UPI003A9407B3
LWRPVRAVCAAGEGGSKTTHQILQAILLRKRLISRKNFKSANNFDFSPSQQGLKHDKNSQTGFSSKAKYDKGEIG